MTQERVALQLWDGKSTDFKDRALTWFPNDSNGAVVACGKGHFAGIGDHEIDQDGNVNPSLKCPEEGCGWHVWGKLVGWKEHGQTTT